MLDQGRLRRLEELFDAASEMTPPQRAALLEAECGDDAELHSELEILFRHDELMKGDFLKSSPENFPSLPSPLEEGQLVGGKYRLLSVLGEGGMGIVYLAEQDSPRRQVALKVLQHGITSPKLLRRFELEHEALGRLHHPGIAQIFEAGVHEEPRPGSRSIARPYFAMEYVEGGTIASYIESRNLDVRQRLELIARICDAVHYAHSRGIIHRDLKPANILVDETDGVAQPKILDFGVARATDADLQMTTMHTEIGQLIGTLPYMSPEQIAGNPDEIDVRSDVYALGVTGYELLTGELPHELKDLAVYEAARVIREEDPRTLSSHRRDLRGDVETIFAKTLSKDKDRRYQSAAELGSDVRRYLQNEPIVARPASTIYQLQKFTRRNKALVGGVVIAFLALVIGMIATSLAMFEARRQRDDASLAKTEAERQTRIAQSVNAFLNTDLLASVAPEAEGIDVTVRQVLDTASNTIEGKFPDEPQVEAAIRLTLGNSYRSLGLHDRSEPHFLRAIELYREEFGDHSDWTLKTTNDLAVLYYEAGRYDEAEPLYLSTLSIRQDQLGEDHLLTLSTLNNLATLYLDQGRYEKAEPMLVRLVGVYKELLGPADPTTLISINNLAQLFSKQGRKDEAGVLLVEALAGHRLVSGDEHPDTLSMMNNLGALYYHQGRLDEAEPLYVEGLEVTRRILGEEHPSTLRSMNNLAVLYKEQGRLDETEVMQKKALELQKRVIGHDHPDTIISMGNLAMLYKALSRFEEAEAMYLETLVLQEAKLGADHPQTVVFLNNLANLYFDTQRYEIAETYYTQAVDVNRRTKPEGFFATGITLFGLGRTLTRLERYPEAESTLLEAHEILSNSFGARHARTIKTVEELIGLYTAWEHPEDEAAWRSRLDHVIE
ncbi:MAG: serine/threonine-protein kinase [Planctomycetota bacterium]|nr:serine/threonine-protein kinase [Planctomycetota bacterium]